MGTAYLRSTFEWPDLKQLYLINSNTRSIEKRKIVFIDYWTSHYIQDDSLSGRIYTRGDQHLGSDVVKRIVLVLGSIKLRRERQISKLNHRFGDEDQY